MRNWKMLITALIITMPAAVFAGTEPTAPQPERGFITGKVLPIAKAGRSSSAAIISIFNVDTGPPPDEGVIRRVPEGLVRVRKSGLFKIVLPPGRYYLGVLFRENSQVKGPPSPDEKFFFPRDAQDKLRQFEVVGGRTTDIGDLSGTEPEKLPEIPDPLVVEGTIRDEQGKPFGGALIMVREKLEVPRPLFISRRTGADGRYRLKLPAGGPYYLVVRENLVNVGRPRPGDFVGTYGGRPPQAAGQAPSLFSGGKPLSGAKNQVLQGIDITMYKIPNPEEVKKRLLEESESPAVPGSVAPQAPGPMRQR